MKSELKPKRVLHLPTTVGGHASAISLEMNSLGIDSQCWAFSQNYLEYPVDKVLIDPGISALGKAWGLVSNGKYIFDKWDAVYFNFGSTLFSHRFPLPSSMSLTYAWQSIANLVLATLQVFELLVLKLRGVKLFVVYQGDDARQSDKSINLFRYSMATQIDINRLTKKKDRFRRRQIKLLSLFCDRIYALNPDLMHFLPSSAVFLPYLHVPVEDVKPALSVGEDRPLRIVHSPTNRQIKGTSYILEALDELREEGYRFELSLVEGLPNSEALQAYASADLAIDQIFAGWYGGFAVEAMSLGKPVMCYIREQDLEFIPARMKEQLPVIGCTVDTLKEDIKATISKSRADLNQLGRQSREYVELWHNRRTTVRQIVDLDLG
jgi:hypothetical protein